MTQADALRLYEAARFERDERVRVFGERARAGTLGNLESAQATTLAWAAIAEGLAGTRHVDVPAALFWADWFDEAAASRPWSLGELELATGRCLTRREQECAEAPNDASRATRRDLVAEIHQIVVSRRALADDVNRRLRAALLPRPSVAA